MVREADTEGDRVLAKVASMSRAGRLAIDHVVVRGAMPKESPF
jgi:hypothetical protein